MFAHYRAQLLATLRFADLVDTLLVAALLFGLFSWLRQSTSQAASRRLVATALCFGVLYLLANSFELFLIEHLLRVLFFIFLVAMVVVFQGEIRRLLAQLGSFNPFAASVSPGDTLIDQLVEASAQLAEARVGALVALKGSEGWDDLIQGGVALGGQVSQPLLYSLFDPQTPGHDGAVLIEGGRVTRFAAHLPLAANLPEASRFGGTRHAAALGLSEHCDALVIVVSEERGVVSLAQGSNLEELGSVGDLKARLETFLQRSDQKERKRWRWVPRLQTASLSLVCAGLLWFFFAYSPDTVSRMVDVPVEFRNLPDDWELAQVSPEFVQVTLVGSEQAFAQLDQNTLTVSFDLSSPRGGSQTFAINEERLELPSSLSVNTLKPEEVRVETRHLVRADVPVEVPTLGSLPPPLTLESLRSEPEQVTLLVPEGVNPRRVLTEPLDLRNVEGDVNVTRQLALPPDWQLEEGDSSVRVAVSVRE